MNPALAQALPGSTRPLPCNLLAGGLGSFYKLWFVFFVGSGAGLIIIGSAAGMAKNSLGEQAWMVVALPAIGNAGGRVVGGLIIIRAGFDVKNRL